MHTLKNNGMLDKLIPRRTNCCFSPPARAWPCDQAGRKMPAIFWISTCHALEFEVWIAKQKKNLIIFVIYSIQSVASLEGNYCLKVMFWLWFNLNLRFYFSSWSSQAQPFRFLSLSLRQTQLQYILWAGAAWRTVCWSTDYIVDPMFYFR